jgi:hypothetical protein
MSLWVDMLDRMDVNGQVEIADFSFSPEPKRFRINDDVFECAPELPLGTFAKIAGMKLDRASLTELGIEPMLQFFDELFIGDSSERFRGRVHDKTRPIGMRHIQKIMPWLLEVYGLRPTEPSEHFSPSPESAGTTSTGGVSSEESIHSSSDQPASSTSFTTTPEPSSSVS